MNQLEFIVRRIAAKGRALRHTGNELYKYIVSQLILNGYVITDDLDAIIKQEVN